MSGRILLTIWLASLFLFTSGCRYLTRTPAEKSLQMVDGPQFENGVLKATEKGSFESVYGTIPKALSALEIPVIDQQPDQGNIFGRTTDGKMVRIHVEKRADGGSDIQIQVAGETEQARARLILDQIRKHAESGF